MKARWAYLFGQVGLQFRASRRPTLFASTLLIHLLLLHERVLGQAGYAANGSLLVPISNVSKTSGHGPDVLK